MEWFEWLERLEWLEWFETVKIGLPRDQNKAGCWFPSPMTASVQRQFLRSAVLNQSQYAAVKRSISASETLGMMMACAFP